MFQVIETQFLMSIESQIKQTEHLSFALRLNGLKCYLVL